MDQPEIRGESSAKGGLAGAGIAHEGEALHRGPQSEGSVSSGWSSKLNTLTWIFLRDHQLRAGWRTLAFWGLALAALVVSLVLAVVVILVWGQLVEQPSNTVLLAIQTAAFFGALVVVHVIGAGVLDARAGRSPASRPGSLRGVGLGGPLGRTIVELVLGTVIGVVGVLLAVAVMALGGLDMHLAELSVQRAVGFVGMSVVLVGAAAFEELAFRGYGALWLGACLARLGRWLLGLAGQERLGALADLVGFGLPMLVISAVFGVFHLLNPSASLLSTVNTFLAGVWLAAMVLRTRSLWMAIAAHWAWNHFHGVVLGFPLSGFDQGMPSLMESRGLGPEWLGGGGYGIEGSVGSTAVLVVLIALCAVLPRRGRDQAHAALVTSPGPDESPRATLSE